MKHTLKVAWIARATVAIVAFVLSLAIATPVLPASASSVVPAAVGSTLKSHCGILAHWADDLNARDSRLKFRVWHYTDRYETRYFCVKIYKVKPKKNRTKIGLDGYSILGNPPSVYSRGASVAILIPTPKDWTSYVRPHYGSLSYQLMTLYGA